ncbi:hypothetical protein U472_07035 [Orenia metallireducens]|uniref:Uncharacterized protein n=1 Tax=Orenia metallireducens TaxID=1413210 RepID=A0A1C0AA96_9FIRM|nr:hypothetical protein [Orenia metallireducens]OCL27217.1 hypothetical protein U472_07035 [Orenia metallireducens]
MENKSNNLFQVLQDSQEIIDGVNNLLDVIRRPESENKGVRRDDSDVKVERILSIKVMEEGQVKFNYDIPLNLLMLSRRFISAKEIRRLNREYGIDIDDIIKRASTTLLEKEKIVDVYNKNNDVKIEVSIL